MEVVDPEDYFNSLTVFLTKDASKSVWKCLTKVTPNILLAGNICGSAVEQRYQRVLRQFAEKYKCEHEDGSCIQISIRNVMRGYVPISNGIPFSSKACTSHFIRLLSKFIDDIAADSQREVCELNGINSGTSLE